MRVSSGIRSPGSAPAGFTLVEIMIAVTLMSVIILGLMAMFSQTQRAFRLGMNQTDVLEAGRIATDMIVREIEQATPTGKQLFATPGFYVELMDLQNLKNTGNQLLPGGDYRTNYMQDLFFVKRENQTWTGIGYFVRTNASIDESFGPVGTLYRFETNNSAFVFGANSNWFWNGFDSARSGFPTNVSKVIEGVVHFSVKTFDVNGNLIAPPWNLSEPPGTPYWWTNFVRADFPHPEIPSGVTRYIFFSNAIPASVELELGILEPQTSERYKAILNTGLKGTYYTNHAGNVHVFRQRIPIRRFDGTAYQ